VRRIALLTFLLVLATAPSAHAAKTVVVRGAGFGHGIGMSQYGAYGFAQQGFDYGRILRHYYRGTTLGRAPSRNVRVLLQASDRFVRFRGATRGPDGRALSPSTTYKATRARGGKVKLTGGGERIGTFLAPLRVTGRVLRLLGPAINGVRSGLYRGGLELHPGAAGGVTAVNSLPIDPYVQGVVAGEVPSGWDDAALRAQAVAARTYALATRKVGGVFDQYPDTRSQVYRGVKGETSRTNAAVSGTAGEVVTYEGDPAVTYFFSTSGGKTENVELSFLGSEPKPWLKSVEDPYDDISPKHRWRFRFTPRRLGARLGAPGRFRKIRVIKRGKSPRIVRARVYGSRGTRLLTGAQIRARLGLYDTWAYFTTVSSSQVKRAKAARSTTRAGRVPRRQIAGVFDPAPRSRSLLVERRVRGRWRLAGRIETTRAGRYRTSLAASGVYRVRWGGVAGPVIRVR
jgi:stage II sporulation protein D